MTETDLVSLGEIMLRFTPPKYERLRRATNFQVRACGAQFNISSNFVALGKKSIFLTKLPDNELGSLAYSLGASFGVDMSHAKFEGDKIGMVFAELGAEPRQTVHLYDRQGSAASQIHPEDFEWDKILAGTHYAFTDGIFPALNQNCFETVLVYLTSAKKAGCLTCFDINYRQSLWKHKNALEVFRKILPHVDILVTNRSVSEQVFNYFGKDEELLDHYKQDYGCQIIALTYKNLLSIHRGTWFSKAYSNGVISQGRLFEFDIIDPFGAGDAFFAGFLFRLMQNNELEYCLDFGNALCALAHTLEGDAAVVSVEEVENLLKEKTINLINR